MTKVSVARDLIRCGVNMNSTDSYGTPVSYNAVEGRSNNVAALLLASGADYLIRDKYGRGLLHFIAIHGSTEIMQMATMARLEGLPNPHHGRDNAGKTALNHFRNRTDYSDELAAA